MARDVYENRSLLNICVKKHAITLILEALGNMQSMKTFLHTSVLKIYYLLLLFHFPTYDLNALLKF